MTRISAIHLRICAASIFGAFLAGFSVASGAQDKGGELAHTGVEKPVPVTEEAITPTDVAATPIEDLNLRKKEIPQLLLAVRDAPYSAEGLDGCEAIGAAVGDLDLVLGADFDIDPDRKRDLKAGRLAKEAVGMLVPYRGLLREASGAAGRKRKIAELILAASTRRAYLKGVGEARGCPYPARPADADTREVLASFDLAD